MSNDTDLAAIDVLHQRDIAATLARDVDELASLFTDDGVLISPGAPA